LPRIVEQLEAEGYRFVLVSDYVGAPRLHQASAPLTAEAVRRKLDEFIERAPVAALLRAMR
jgi:hypothetical protein